MLQLDWRSWRRPQVFLAAIVTALFLVGLYAVVHTGVGGTSIADDASRPVVDGPTDPGSATATGTPGGSTGSSGAHTTDGGSGHGGSGGSGRRAIRLGGVTLDNDYPVDNFNGIMDGSQDLDGGTCGYLYNGTGITLRVSRISLTLSHGKGILHGVCGGDYGGRHVNPDDPACSGARIPPGGHCWVGIEIVAQARQRATGKLALDLTGTCRSTRPPICQGLTSSRFPVTVFNTLAFHFGIAADESEEETTKPEPEQSTTGPEPTSEEPSAGQPTTDAATSDQLVVPPL